jgi:hypothetical protein
MPTHPISYRNFKTASFLHGAKFSLSVPKHPLTVSSAVHGRLIGEMNIGLLDQTREAKMTEKFGRHWSF